MNKLKNMLFAEKGNIKKSNAAIKGTRVRIINEETGECLFEGSNKVIVSGSAFTAAKHFNLTPPVWTPSYNTVLGLENTENVPFNEQGLRRDNQVFLFAVGTDGCGPEAFQVFDVNYTKWIAPQALVPFRYPESSNDLSHAEQQKYFGRKTIGDRVAYYFKAFDSVSQIIQQYTDGTPIDENIYLSERKDEVETYVELKLSITEEDCREFFLATTGIKSAKVNTLSLLTAYPSTIDNQLVYQEIRPLTKINFPNEPLIDTTKQLAIIYQIFY